MAGIIKNRVNRAIESFQPHYYWWFLVFAGIIQRLRQYIANRSLWADEASLALNIVNRNFIGLTQPLNSNQGAPIGFLFVEKLLITIFGNFDYILRLFPLFCGISAVYLMYRTSREAIGWFGLFGLLMFNLSWNLVNYSSELKQYSTDTAAALLILLLTLRYTNNASTDRALWVLCIAGILCMWLSHPAVFIIGGVGLLLGYQAITIKTGHSLPKLAITGFLWAANLWFIYNLSLQGLASNNYLENYWSRDFLPLPIWEHWDWLGIAYLELLSTSTSVYTPLPLYLTVACSILILFGLFPDHENPKNKFLIAASILTGSITLLASALHLYPFNGRFLHYLIPYVFLLMANGLRNIYWLVNLWNRKIALAIISVFILAVAIQPFATVTKAFIDPPLGEHIKPAMAFIRQNMELDDIIYIYYGGNGAFEYYESFYGLEHSNRIFGTRNRENPEIYLKEINALLGNKRVWFIFSHNCDQCIVHEQRYFIQHLNQWGQVQKKFQKDGVNLYLYDLSQ